MGYYMEVKPMGRPLKYKPRELYDKFIEYVQWCESNPIVVRQETAYTNGNGSETKEYKPRYVSVGGFLIYIGGYEEWWRGLDHTKQGAEFIRVKDLIRAQCEQYQKELAVAGVTNANIISKLLGLADKKEVQASGDGITFVVRSQEQKETLEDIKDLGV